MRRTLTWWRLDYCLNPAQIVDLKIIYIIMIQIGSSYYRLDLLVYLLIHSTAEMVIYFCIFYQNVHNVTFCMLDIYDNDEADVILHVLVQCSCGCTNLQYSSQL